MVEWGLQDKSVEWGLGDKSAATLDPAEEERQIKETVDISYDLGISVADANTNYKQIADKPEKRPPSKAEFSFVAATPSKWEKFKGFFVGTRDPLPPNADRIEKITRAFDIGMGLPLRAFMKFSKGMTLGAPDLMWGAIKRITPDDMWDDEVKNMTLDEAMDWAGGYDPSGFQKAVGELAEFGGRLKAVAPIAQKIGIIGNTPKDITVLDKAFESAKLFGAAAVGEQISKYAAAKIDPTETEYGYEGPKAVLRDMAIGAAFSLLHSGVKGAWSRLTPTEHQRALKLLGVKEGATANEIKAAARNLFRKYHPDKAKGFQTEFENVIKARDTLIKGEPQDIVFRGQKVVFKPKLLEGETVQQQAIRLAQKPTKPLIKPPSKAVEPTKPKEGVVAPKKAKQPWEMTLEEYRVINDEQNLQVQKLQKKRDMAVKLYGEDSSEVREAKKELRDAEQEMISQHPDAAHKIQIKRALAAGKPVPAEVLAEYPDLAKPKEPTITPKGGELSPEQIGKELGGIGHLVPWYESLARRFMNISEKGAREALFDQKFEELLVREETTNPDSGLSKMSEKTRERWAKEAFDDLDRLTHPPTEAPIKPPSKAVEPTTEPRVVEIAEEAITKPAEVSVEKAKKEMVRIPVKDIELFDELRNNTIDFNKKRVGKKRQSEIIERSKELRRKLGQKGYAPEYIKAVEMGDTGIPFPPKTPAKPTKPKEPTVTQEGKVTLQEAKAKAHLDSKIRLGSGQQITRRQNLENLNAKGWKAEKTEGVRPMSQAELTELAALKKTAPIGNEGHPATIRLKELQAKQKEGRPDIRYRAMAPDNTFQKLSKTEYEYLLSLEEAKQPPAKPKGKARDILGGVDPITQINKALTDAVEIRPLVEKERKVELRKRVGAAAGALKSSLTKRKISAEESIGRSTGLLKGPLSNARFESIRDVIEDAQPGAIDEAFRSIGDNKKLKYFEIVETKEAFAKLIDGIPVTLREVDMIKRQFGIEMGEIAKARAEKSSLSDRLWNFWRAGLLTGAKTSGLNIFSTLTHSVMETEKDLIAAPVDILISQLTGKRTLGFTWKGIPKGVKEGVIKGWEYLWTGVSERDIGKKFDFVPINYGNSKIGKAVQAYVETIFHLMGAEDQPFFYGAMSRAIRSQAIAEGRNQKLKGQEFKDFVEKTSLSPTGEMLETAMKDAEQAVFQNRTVLGDIASHIQKAPVVRWAVPFSRTPSAVAMQIINYTPLGTMKEVAAQIHKGEFDQRKFSQSIGRSVVGTPALAIGALLLAKGLMTLDYPDGERERKLWELEGKKPFAIKVGDKWRSVYVLGPVGNVLMIGGYFQKALTESGSPSESMVTAMAGGGKSFTEQTFVIGMSRAIDAIKDPERSFDRFFTGMAGSFVPTILADVARATDYTERTYKGPWQGIVNRIPGARTTLEERLDVFGQDLPRYGGNPLEVMIDASRPVKIRQDVVVDELKRLWYEDVKVAPTQLGNRDGYKSLTQEENTVLWRRAGEAAYQSLFELIKKRSYLRKSDKEKGKLIEKEVKEAKDNARAEIAEIKINQGMTIQELKESGLVTSDVEPLIRRRRR